jgi:hypothetical protein
MHVQHEQLFCARARSPPARSRARLPPRLEAQAVDAEREQLLALGHGELARELGRGGRPDARAEALRQAVAFKSSALEPSRLHFIHFVTVVAAYCTAQHLTVTLEV